MSCFSIKPDSNPTLLPWHFKNKNRSSLIANISHRSFSYFVVEILKTFGHIFTF